MSTLNFLEKISNSNSNKLSKVVNVFSFETPIGELVAAADDEFIYTVIFRDSKSFEKSFKTLCEELSCSFKQQRNGILKKFEDELQSYLEGDLKKFTVPIKTHGSDFQKEVWNKLLELPYGSTQSYGDLAKSMGRPASHSRAVGAACGANAHVVVIPCHRLVAAASKGGFSCGIDRKEWLLDLEKKHS